MVRNQVGVIKMTERRVDCPVTINDSMRLGPFANAFRIVHDCGNEFFLDFIQYSGSENIALVVSRVRIQGPFMAAIRDRLSETLAEVAPDGGKSNPIIIRMDDGDPN